MPGEWWALYNASKAVHITVFVLFIWNIWQIDDNPHKHSIHLDDSKPSNRYMRKKKDITEFKRRKTNNVLFVFTLQALLMHYDFLFCVFMGFLTDYVIKSISYFCFISWLFLFCFFFFCCCCYFCPTWISFLFIFILHFTLLLSLRCLFAFYWKKEQGWVQMGEMVGKN